MKKICFITTGDIKSIATAKRALGLANPLSDLGWEVSVIMEDTIENHHRCELECDSRTKVKYFPRCSCKQEMKYKNNFIKEIDPDFVYICAFVTRNIVGVGHRSKKLVEHSELQSGIPDVKGFKKIINYFFEFYSLIYANGVLNASKYLHKINKQRAKKLIRSNVPMLYYPYAYNPNVINIKYDEARIKYPQFKDTINFVFLGTVTRNYGIFTVLEAVKELKLSRDNFKMLVLGKGRHYDEAQKYVDKEGLSDVVFMPGFIDEEEISEFFSLASAFVSPMNNTIQDWARCPSKMYLYLPYKKPIITCKIGEPYEILKEKGYYYDAGNSRSLKNQMCKINSKDLEASIYVEEHTWKTRASELNNWIITAVNKNEK